MAAGVGYYDMRVTCVMRLDAGYISHGPCHNSRSRPDVAAMGTSDAAETNPCHGQWVYLLDRSFHHRTLVVRSRPRRAAAQVAACGARHTAGCPSSSPPIHRSQPFLPLGSRSYVPGGAGGAALGLSGALGAGAAAAGAAGRRRSAHRGCCRVLAT